MAALITWRRVPEQITTRAYCEFKVLTKPFGGLSAVRLPAIAHTEQLSDSRRVQAVFVNRMAVEEFGSVESELRLVRARRSAIVELLGRSAIGQKFVQPDRAFGHKFGSITIHNHLLIFFLFLFSSIRSENIFYLPYS